MSNSVRAAAGKVQRLVPRRAGVTHGPTRRTATKTSAWPEVVFRQLPAGAGRVAVLGRHAGGGIARKILTTRPDLTVVKISHDTSPSDRHVRLSEAGPFDLVVDDTGEPQGSARRLKDLIFHVVPGGSLVMRRAGAYRRHRRGVPGHELGRLLRAAQRAAEGAEPDRRGAGGETDAYSLAEAVSSWRGEAGHLVLTSEASRVSVKLDDDEADALFGASGSGHRLLQLVPAAHLESRCELRESATERGVNQPTAYDAPDVRLREYDDVVVWPSAMVTKDRYILPDSFRHNVAKRLRSRAYDELAPRFGRVPALDHDPETLPGTWCHLDNELRGHFGHAMTEQISRLWAWPLVKERYPDAKAIVTANYREHVADWELQLLEAAGVERSDVVLLDRPTRVERLVSPGPLLSNPAYIHPAITEVWRTVGDSLARSATREDFNPRIFCSRRLTKRACNNTAEVETLFAERGFEIVYPEDYALGDQVQMFREAEVVAGFAGSGVFQLALTDSAKRVILVASERYTARNEYLMASVLGHSIAQVTSRPDDPRSFQSPFTFDHEREGVWLREVLDELD